MLKSEFIATYRATVVAKFPWAQDTAKLERFMESVTTTLTTDRATWLAEGDAVKEAWQTIGGKGRPTLKALRALS